MTQDALRFLGDVTARPLSTTVARYQRLHLSRRRGNAIRQQLADAGIIEAATIATRSGQVVLCQLTDHGRSVCATAGIDPGAVPRANLEHRYWVKRTAEHFQDLGYDVTREHPVPNDGFIDLLAEHPGERVAIEIETGKSDIAANVANAPRAEVDRIVSSLPPHRLR